MIENWREIKDQSKMSNILKVGVPKGENKGREITKGIIIYF